MQDRNVLASKLKPGKLILRKVIKIVATRCHILKLKCIKFDFGLGSVTDPAGGAYSAPPDPVARFKGPTSKGREGGGREGEETKGEGRVREGRPVLSIQFVGNPNTPTSSDSLTITKLS